MIKERPPILPAIGAFILWVVTTAVGIYCIILVHRTLNVLYQIFAGFTADRELAFESRYIITAVQDFSLVILASIWLLFFLITNNIHYKHVTKPRSWRLFGWTIGVELLIIIVDWVFINSYLT
ncbi:MAG: hypothetical protein AAF485_00925 [Chloroflexota bacterium]